MLSGYRVALAFIFLLLLSGGLLAQENLTQYRYRFESERFDIQVTDLKVDRSGNGELRYRKRDDNDEINLPVKLLPATIQKLETTFEALRFIDSSESYQGNAQMNHLGKVTIGYSQGSRSREASFNYTDNKQVLKLVELFRAIENQQRRTNDIKLARQYAPLDLPRLLKSLEEELKRDRIAEPQEMMRFLNELAVDESLPLIARNSAQKMANNIKKGNK